MRDTSLDTDRIDRIWRWIHNNVPGEPRDSADVADVVIRLLSELAERETPADTFMPVTLELFAVVRACADGYGENMPYMGMHDAAKRLYRMGYRKVAAPELATCRRCSAESVVTAQSVCIECVGKPSHPEVPNAR